MVLVGKVTELWRYPVSSVGGERIETLDASAENGVPGDRNFAIVDRATGEVASPGGAVRWRPSLQIRARFCVDGTTQVRLPTTDWLDVPSPASTQALSDHFGFAVEIRPYRDRADAPNYAGKWTTNRYQPSPLHILTTASLDELKRLHPEGNPDRRRFRPSVMVDMQAVEGSFPETEWLGRSLQIGGMQMRIDEPTRRCGMTIIAQDDVPHDPEILRQLVRRNGHNIGVYCTPHAHGTIRLGDEVQLI